MSKICNFGYVICQNVYRFPESRIVAYAARCQIVKKMRPVNFGGKRQKSQLVQIEANKRLVAFQGHQQEDPTNRIRGKLSTVLEYTGCANFWSIIFQGKIEAELQILTKEEAEINPVGMARQGPEPLPPPK